MMRAAFSSLCGVLALALVTSAQAEPPKPAPKTPAAAAARSAPLTPLSPPSGAGQAPVNAFEDLKVRPLVIMPSPHAQATTTAREGSVANGPPQRAVKPSATRRFELVDASGKHRFEVSLTASGWVDSRALDYLSKTLRVLELTNLQRPELAAVRDSKAGLDGTSDEVLVTLRALDGSDVTHFVALPPDGFEFARPGVLMLKPDLAAGFSKQTGKTFSKPAGDIGRSTSALTGSFSGVTGTLQCRTGSGSALPLPFATVIMDGQRIRANAAGIFSTSGNFGTGTYSFTVLYDSQVGSGSTITPLQVMDDVHAARSENVRQASTGVAGDVVQLGNIVLTSADCEIFRLGTVILQDYHTKIGRSPPAGKLRLKRWSAVWDGTPYTYYDYMVLSTGFPTQGNYANETTRRRTFFHEFGHSVRHVADGDELHWGWDNFRWAYARSHTGCEVSNVQYAFNEGWAQFWGTQSGLSSGSCSPALPATFLDWNEDQIGQQLTRLASTLCAPSAPGDCARKMVEVLERNPGAIHSIREFEVKYCQLFSAGNSNCSSSGAPARTTPPSCPPGYHDDGATCRLENILAKPSYGRGVGVVPTVCGAGRELDAGLCYDNCRSGYSGVGPVCWGRCPSGFRDDGAFCAKPDAYGRGAGYPWQFGDGFDLNGARGRCEADHGAGNCEQNGAIIYPKCRSNFHNVGCCICSPDCPSGMTDIGVSCAKASYGRGAGTVPNQCQAGFEYDTGLCYTPCRSGNHGVGPVCWGSCPAGFTDHGATCYRDPHIIVKY